MSHICILWCMIVGHRDYPKSSGGFLCQDNADASHTVSQLYMKRKRARVTIEGQSVLLKISLQIKMVDFLLNTQNHRMNHIFLGILLNP